MAHTIKAHKFFLAHSLTVDDTGVTFQNTSVASGKRHFTFPQITCVLMSSENVLSFQIDEEVFTIPVLPDNAQHQQAIDGLLKGVKSATTAM